MSQVWEENIKVIYEYINAHKEGRFDIPNILVGKAYILINLMVTPLSFYLSP